MSYYYPNSIISGRYEINNHLKTDENDKQIFIESDIESVFPGSGALVGYNETGIQIDFSGELSAEDAARLDVIIQNHKDYIPSQIECINANWETLYIDYKKARCELKILVWGIGFNNLTLIGKRIASKWFVVPLDMRTTVHTLEEQLENGKYFHNESVAARKKRADAGISAMYNYLSIPDSFSVVDDIVNTYGLLDKYIKYGREGTLEDGMDGLFDYLCSRDGSMYSGAGFLNKNITPLGVPISALSNAAMSIFKSGNYS